MTPGQRATRSHSYRTTSSPNLTALALAGKERLNNNVNLSRVMLIQPRSLLLIQPWSLM